MSPSNRKSSSYTPAIMFINEDFPTPLAPKMHKISPFFILRLRPFIKIFSFGEFHFSVMFFNSSNFVYPDIKIYTYKCLFINIKYDERSF